MFDVNGVFEGFSLSQEFTLPVEWQQISRRIDNLAEYKVVELVLWVTWGDDRAGDLVPLTYEYIAQYTGLSKQSVAAGIERGIEHGYIERQIEYYTEDGRVHSERTYGLKLYQPENKSVEDQESLFSDQAALEAYSPETQESLFSLSNEFERSTHSNNYDDISRIREEPNNVDAGQHPCKGPLLSRKDNWTLCHHVEWFSDNLGDREHTASNIGQHRRILAQYQARGGNFEDFLLLMQQARETAQKKTDIKHKKGKNRNAMPYYFACLRRACSSGHVLTEAASQAA